MEKRKIDSDFFEIVVIYNLLTDPLYLGSVIDSLDSRFFKDKNISAIVDVISTFFIERGSAPTITEVKTKLDTDELRDTFRSVVSQFTDIDKRFNKDELFENTEKFLKEKAVYHTMLSVADDCNAGHIDTSSILDQFETACNIDLSSDTGLHFFDQVDRCIDDLKKEQEY